MARFPWQIMQSTRIAGVDFRWKCSSIFCYLSLEHIHGVQSASTNNSFVRTEQARAAYAIIAFWKDDTVSHLLALEQNESEPGAKKF